MKRYKSLVNEKKKLVRKVEAIMETRAAYTYVPRCAYQVGCIFIEKDGNLTTENEEETADVIAKLQEEGFLGGEMEVNPTPAKVHLVRAERREQTPAEQTNTNYFEPIMETWQPETSTEERPADVSSRAWEFPSFSIPVRRAAETLAQEDTGEESSEEQTEETREDPAETTAEETEEAVVEEEPEAEPVEEEGAGAADAATEEGFPLDAVISFPLAGHTGLTLINLINIIYSRGSLLSKATAGEFSCDAEFVKELGLESGLYQTEQLLEFIRNYEAAHGKVICGISFEEDKVNFDGFRTIPDAAHFQSFMVLAERINKMCLTQNRVQAKDVDESNEKYALRTWLNRLGMKGQTYKLARKHLMEHLSGHTAFRTKEEEERAKQKALLNKAKG